MLRIRNRKPASDERGMVVVEAVISFTAFIMVCLGIAFLINIFTLHNKVQYAVNQAAHELASYSYLYDALGLRRGEIQLGKDGDEYTAAIDDTTDQLADTYVKLQTFLDDANNTATTVQDADLSNFDIDALKGQLNTLKASGQGTLDSGKASIESLKEAFSNPKGLIVGFLYIGADFLAYEAKGIIADAMAGALVEKYLAAGGVDVDRYLQSFGLKNGYDDLDFSASSVFCDGEEGSDDGKRVIDLVVEYDIDLSFITYVLPKTVYHVTQRVSVAAWCGGDGQVVTVGIPE